jgi:hypothetical protein
VTAGELEGQYVVLAQADRTVLLAAILGTGVRIGNAAAPRDHVERTPRGGVVRILLGVTNAAARNGEALLKSMFVTGEDKIDAVPIHNGRKCLPQNQDFLGIPAVRGADITIRRVMEVNNLPQTICCGEVVLKPLELLDGRCYPTAVE